MNKTKRFTRFAKKNPVLAVLFLTLAAVVLYFYLSNYDLPAENPPVDSSEETNTSVPDDDDVIPEFSGEPFVELNGNVPIFGADEFSDRSYEYYSELDEYGRCGMAIASVGQDLMPTEDRESISHIHPTGWHSMRYDFVPGGNLYNRCHLIGFQLTGENANEKNLITGTRYLNIEGMLPFENMIADYVKETGNHVVYRVTPVFEGKELVARGVILEAKSVEDNGEGVMFNVYAYNVQPGVIIDYKTGQSTADPDYTVTGCITFENGFLAAELIIKKRSLSGAFLHFKIPSRRIRHCFRPCEERRLLQACKLHCNIRELSASCLTEL